MTKYEQVLKVVQAACDLSVARACDGCKGSGDEWPFGSQFHKPGERCLDCEGRGYFGHNEPARLSHVLRAMDSVLGEDSWEYAIRPDGYFICDWGEGRHEVTSDRYDLTKDDLSLQPEETINLLFDILCK